MECGIAINTTWDKYQEPIIIIVFNNILDSDQYTGLFLLFLEIGGVVPHENILIFHLE
jgi:hypothetical protein